MNATTIQNSRTTRQPISIKGILGKLTMAGAIAAALSMASPQAAQAQQFQARVGFGHPAFYGPSFHPGFYPDRRARFARHEAFERHEEFARRDAFEHRRWERGAPFRGRAYGFDR